MGRFYANASLLIVSIRVVSIRPGLQDVIGSKLQPQVDQRRRIHGRADRFVQWPGL